MSWKNVQVSMQIRLITEAVVHRQRNDCSTDFGKFPAKQPLWIPNLVQI